MKLPSRRRLRFYASLVVFAIIAFYFRRDLRLGLNLSDIVVPDIVVENIEIKRVVEGNEWILLSPRAEHKQGMLYGRSIDITVTAASGDVSRLFAENGLFSRESNNVTLEDMDANMVRDGKNVKMKAGTAHYESAEDKWYFSNDVEIADGSAEARGPEGSYSVKEGLSLITGGGTVTWVD